MSDRTHEISIKVDNGGELLNYEDLQYLINRVKESTAIINRIAVVSNNAHDSQHSIRQALNTVKALTANFTGE